MTIANNLRPFDTTPVLTSQELKDFYLFGVNMTDDDGNPYPAPIFDYYIQAATDWLEAELPGVLMRKTVITGETHDFYATDYQSWGFLKLFHLPALSVEAIRIQFPLAVTPLVIDASWFRIESTSAQCNLVPTVGTISSLFMGQGGNFLPLLSHRDLPHTWSIDYTAGFDTGKIPGVMRHLIGMKAAMGPLNIAGDLLAGAGISSKSLGIDGISQSISTTSSPEFSGYGARIRNYQKEIDDTLKKLKMSYCGFAMAVM